jgi:hypothetical protein
MRAAAPARTRCTSPHWDCRYWVWTWRQRHWRSPGRRRRIAGFGFSLDFQGPPDDLYHGQVSRDGVGIMLKANPFRFEVTDADGYVLAFFQLRGSTTRSDVG